MDAIPPPIFIIGSPRSGTTLLAQLLEETPWGESFETHFIPKYYRTLFRFGDLSDRTAFCRLAREILAERPIVQRALGVDADMLYDAAPRHDYAALVNQIGLAYARRRGHASWGDKTPAYLEDVDLLHRLFPDSKMLYVIRDGRDVALSLQRKSWGPANVYMCARSWQRENQPQPILATLRTRGLLHDVRYEDLLADPAAELSRIGAFLGFDLGRERIDALAARVRRLNRDKWPHEMSEAQIRLFEEVAGDTLRRLGYRVSHEPRAIGAVRTAAYRAHDALKHGRNLFMMNVVDTIAIRCLGKEPFAQ